MEKIVSWTIINNEIEFIKDIFEYHSPWLDGMYFLDTGSTDGTLEYLKSIQSEKVIIEEYHTKFTPQYGKDWLEIKDPFPEVEIRNFALTRVSAIFNPKWLIQLDGDEVFLEKTREIIEVNKAFDIISHSTINPVCKLEDHPIEKRDGKVMYDPHARIWKAEVWIKYVSNPAFKGKQIHCIPVCNGKHVYYHKKNKWIAEPFHYHLHWMYGKKTSIKYLDVQHTNLFSGYLPVVFWQRRNNWIASQNIE